MPTIVQNISPALIEGATAIYIGGVRLFPACAGMNRRSPAPRRLPNTVPRMRGDEPFRV